MASTQKEPHRKNSIWHNVCLSASLSPPSLPPPPRHSVLAHLWGSSTQIRRERVRGTARGRKSLKGMIQAWKKQDGKTFREGMLPETKRHLH
jgi:hypothetical protein